VATIIGKLAKNDFSVFFSPLRILHALTKKIFSSSREMETTENQRADVPSRGYVITDLDFLMNWILNGHKNCNGDLKMTYGTKMGAKQMLTITYPTCGYTNKGGTCRSSKELNTSLVVATIASGNGFKGLDTIFGLVGIQNQSESLYHETESLLTAPINQLLEKILDENNAEEYERASPQEGTEMRKIQVEYDMCYSQNNKGLNKYNSDSGVGLLLGSNTGKPLYVGVKNKRCTLCNTNETSKKKKKGAKNLPKDQKNKKDNGHDALKTGKAVQVQWNRL
jgi:hypothetical protein